MKVSIKAGPVAKSVFWVVEIKDEGLEFVGNFHRREEFAEAWENASGWAIGWMECARDVSCVACSSM